MRGHAYPLHNKLVPDGRSRGGILYVAEVAICVEVENVVKQVRGAGSAR